MSCIIVLITDKEELKMKTHVFAVFWSEKFHNYIKAIISRFSVIFIINNSLLIYF